MFIAFFDFAASNLNSTTDATAPFMNSVFSSEPTTERQSIWTRFYNNYVAGLLLIPQLGSVFEEFTAIREELGISSAKDVFASKVKGSVKLINNFYGLEIARAIGPLIKFVGPIMPSTYPEMDAATLDFLTLHQKIVYVAFGHHVIPTAQEFEKVLVSLVDSVEDGTVDGFIWATVQVSDFPEKIVTSKGSKLNVTEILERPSKYPHYNFVKWAPQFAVLSHPSTALFMTHGGANSLFESLYTGKKTLIHPYLADQPSNGQIMADAGVALVNNRYKVTSKDIAAKIRTLVQDKDGFFADNLNRMSALAQLKAIDAVDRAVAAVEEVLFTSKGDELPHLTPPSSKMTYMKANNIDIHILLATCIVSVVALALGIVYKIVRASVILFGKMKKSKLE
jgi:UDP-glucoronosyl and UDP-glucosyl transferase